MNLHGIADHQGGRETHGRAQARLDKPGSLHELEHVFGLGRKYTAETSRFASRVGRSSGRSVRITVPPPGAASTAAARPQSPWPAPSSTYQSADTQSWQPSTMDSSTGVEGVALPTSRSETKVNLSVFESRTQTKKRADSGTRRRGT